MVPHSRVRIKYGAGGSHIVKEAAYEYNRYADPHLAAYLKKRKVKVPGRVTSSSQVLKSQNISAYRLSVPKYLKKDYSNEYLTNSDSPD